MRHGGWSWSAHRALLVVWVLVLLLGVPSAAHAGRNANGALIVHTNDAVSYTYSGDYCGVDYDAPDSCGAAGTRTDKDENTPAVIWLLAAFPDSSSPAVTAIQFGIDHNLPSGQGYFENYEMCGSLELPDAGWPETGFGNLVSFGSTVHTEKLFPFYWFAVYGFEHAYFGTAVYPSTEEAKFVDDSTPPMEDLVTRFGTVRWYAAGSNDCPQGGGGDDGPSGPGDDDEWLDGDGERLWERDCLLVCLREDLPMPPRDPADQLGIPAIDGLGQQLGLASVQRVVLLDDMTCSRYPVGSHLVKIRFGSETDELDVARRLEGLPEVLWAYPNYASPVDYFNTQQVDEPTEAQGAFDQQWPLKWTGNVKSCINQSWELDCCPDCDIGLDQAWEFTRGNPNVIVAFIDAGADMQHLDLFDAYLVNWNEDNGDGIIKLCADSLGGDIDGADDDPNGGNGIADDILMGWQIRPHSPPPPSWEAHWEHRPDLQNGHGTSVAGHLGAITNNGKGVASVAGGDASQETPGVRLIQFSIAVALVPADALIATFYYAHAAGARVYSSSAGLIPWPGVPEVVSELADSMLFVQAVGNNGGTPMTSAFARLPGVMAVGGYDCSGGRWKIPGGGYQGWRGSDYGDELALMGPAGDNDPNLPYERMVFASTSPATDWPPYTCDPTSVDAIGCFGGTSAATPNVASVAALVFSYAEDHGDTVTVDQVRKILTRTAEDIRCDPLLSQCDCSNTSECVELIGHDQFSGYGRVDAGSALTLPVAALDPLSPYEDFVIWSGGVHLSWETLDLDPLNGGTPDHLELHYLIPEDEEGWRLLADTLRWGMDTHFDWTVSDSLAVGDNRYFRLSVVDSTGATLNADYRRFSVLETTDVDREEGAGSSVLGIWPNPTPSGTWIRYVLGKPGQVRVEVFDVAGRRVKTLVHGPEPTGSRTLQWDGRDDSGHLVASGIYFIRLHLGTGITTARLVRIR